MSVPITLHNPTSTKRSPTPKSKYSRQPLTNQSMNFFFNQISHKLYDVKNLNQKKKIVILDQFPLPHAEDDIKQDIQGSITGRYEPVQIFNQDFGLVRCKKVVISQKKNQNNRKNQRKSSPPRSQLKRRNSFQQSTKKR